MQVVKVYRPEDQVFDKASLGGYSHKDCDERSSRRGGNRRQLEIPFRRPDGDEVARDGEFVRVRLIVMDGAAIGEIEGGKRELSAGYTCDLAWEAGTTPGGEKYDAIQKDINIARRRPHR